jgi:hypothetical protein
MNQTGTLQLQLLLPPAYMHRGTESCGTSLTGCTADADMTKFADLC